MKKGQACIVRGCKSTKRSMRHRFPRDPVKSYIWSHAIKNLELQQMRVEERQKFYVCHQHFPQEAYKLTLSRCQLTDTAVPSLKIPVESLPSTSIGNDGVNEIQEEPALPLNLRDEEQPEIMDSSSSAQENTILCFSKDNMTN